MNDVDFTTYDYIIGGKLVVGKVTMDDSYFAMLNDVDAKQHVKDKLAKDLATYMLENNLLEFTQFQDPISSTKTIMVRAYVAPNDQVKILRLANKIV